jgi:hypothetical protein
MALKSYQHSLSKAAKLSKGGLLLRSLLCLAIIGGNTNLAFARSQEQGSSHIRAKARASSPVARSVKKKTAARPSANTALLARGAVLHKEGKVDEAEAIFRDVLAHDPCNVDAFYDLGAIAEARGDLIGALGSYHAALALRPGDKELKEAVTSTERAIRKGALTKGVLTIKHDYAKPGRKDSTLGAAPQPPFDKTLNAGPMQPLSPPADSGHELTTAASQHTGPADVQALSSALAKAQEDCRDPAKGDSDKKNEAIFSIPQDDVAPQAKDGNTFSLSSRKGAIVPPSLGVPLDQSDVPSLGITPDQFPDMPTGLAGRTTTGVPCPPPCPPVLAVGQTQTRGTNANLRRGAMMLSIGAGVVLGGALHCPICHMMRGHF